MTRRLTMFVALAVTASSALAGCATFRQSQADNTGQFLAAAGFRMQRTEAAPGRPLTDTPPYRLTRRVTTQGTEWIYVDPTACRCAYSGGPTEYAEYQRLTHRRELAQQEFWGAPNPWSSSAPGIRP
jgi:hypothetical protein